MPTPKRRVSLIIFVVATLLVVGMVPLVLTGWLLSDKSGKELRAAENRYQIQLVQEKAKQLEIFGNRWTSVLSSLSTALELSNDANVLSSTQTEAKLGAILKENPDLVGLYIRPSSGDPVSVFRAESLSRSDVESLALDVIGREAKAKTAVDGPRRVGSAHQPVMAFARPVFVGGAKAADIVAVASIAGITPSIVGFSSTKESELWNAGLPIVFVVDGAGETVFHPDPSVATERKPMSDLKIVQEWLESGRQVQSALVPFDATYDNKKYTMIGAYSTATMADGYNVGVIAMQDESRALASVGEMRSQTWMVSLAFAVFALAIGLVLSRYMTAPLLKLVDAAKQIAHGDFSARVSTENITEIGTLSETFNFMGGKIEEQIANLARAAQENRELFVGTVKALAAAIDGKDKYTRGHSERVARISVAIGKRMGMSDDELETLRISALLHDVGKIAIDDSILKKPAALTDEEYEIMKTHPKAGYKIMSQIPAMEPYLPGMYMHHEMVNGKGYPQGLTGDQIPLQGKIVSVADTFDAMTIDRPYSKGMELDAALERLRSFVGTRYESDVVEALVAACHAGEVANGIVRQLADKRAAEARQSEALLDRLVA
ncbi:MAG TPA: HD domain-containing phosphohydrolase [Pyrinomonadaceae bacterium]|nr:HD domain-containing phosphohydrolase [Pyrinomonadaceae bacterium]